MPRETEQTVDELLLRTLSMLAPGSVLHEALENILRARTGALIVVGDSPEVLALVNGGFHIDAEITPAALYELAKMDGALILSRDAKRILYANTHLTPDPSIPTRETGTRHRTAERIARQTGELVISISQRRNVITLYRGAMRYVMRDVGVILAKASQALATLERYKGLYQETLQNLSALELEGLATLSDVLTCVQRAQMVQRITSEIERYIVELGTEGRLVVMQLEELLMDMHDEDLLVIRDYASGGREAKPEEVVAALRQWTSEELLDLTLIAKAMGIQKTAAEFDTPVTPRGYRLLHKIPRLPEPVIDNLVAHFGSLPEIMAASIEELDVVEGIGEARARTIVEGLRRLRDQVLLERPM
ncbi:MAG: DNA integrity scanning protein DisA [Firmicutes bacterium]|nr:DNA integrity scanning protein DisA [Bacillota bacterium]